MSAQPRPGIGRYCMISSHGRGLDGKVADKAPQNAMPSKQHCGASLKDLGKNADRIDDLIRNRIRNRNTIEFLGRWEQLNNPDFKPVEFDGFENQAGLSSFTLTPSSGSKKPAPSACFPRPGAIVLKTSMPISSVTNSSMRRDSND